MNTKTYSQVMDAAGTFIISGNYYAAGFVSRASVENGIKLGYPVYAIIHGETFRVILGATFEAGRKYMTSSGEEITVTKRTACYVTYTDGRETRTVKARKDLFSEHEYIMIPTACPEMSFFCVATDAVGFD